MNIRQFLKLSQFFIKEPFLIIPTYKASRETLEICNSKFGKQHHMDNKANAFRHALWNFILCRNYYERNRSLDASLVKSKKITDLHETLFTNEKPARLMDLHNNKIGRSLFYKDKQFDIVRQLELMMNEAKKLESVADIKEADSYLVYLED